MCNLEHNYLLDKYNASMLHKIKMLYARKVGNQYIYSAKFI